MDDIETTPHLGPIDFAMLLLLIAGTLALYWQTRNFEYLRFDDPLYVSQNRFVLGGLNTHSFRYAMTANVSGNWHPVTLLTEMATVQLFGSSSATFHLLCASLHAVNAGLLFLFLRWTTRLRWPPMLAVMLWAWHPLRVESVAWVGELKDVLCGFFWLATMLAFLHFRKRPAVGRYLAVFACAALAMLSKSMAITLPAALMLLNFWPLRVSSEPLDYQWWKKRVLEQLPLLLLGIIISLTAMRTQRDSGFTGSSETFPLPLRITNALSSYLRYIGKEIVPINMGLIYPHPGMLGRTVPVQQWAAALLILSAITSITWHLRRSKPFLIVGWLWFLGTMIPVIGLVQLGEASMADRYTYIPAIGLTTAVVWLLCELPTHRPRWQSTAVICGSVVLIALVSVSSNQIAYWKDNYTLISHSNAVIDDNFLAMSSLAMDDASAGRIGEAVRLGRAAVKLVPQNQEAHHALAIALRAADDLPGSLREYVSSIKLDPYRPSLRMEIGQLLVEMRRTSDAQGQFQRASELDPTSAEAHHDLAGTLAAQGDYDRAIAQWKIAVTLEPHYTLAQELLADALRLRGDRAGAIEHYRMALNDGATDPTLKANLTWELAIDPATSAADLQAILPIAHEACEQTHSKLPFPLYAYSLALARLNRFDEAIHAASTALKGAEADHQDAMATEIRKRLEAYRRGKIAG